MLQREASCKEKCLFSQTDNQPFPSSSSLLLFCAKSQWTFVIAVFSQSLHFMHLSNMENNVLIGLSVSHTCATQDSLPVLRTAQLWPQFQKSQQGAFLPQSPSLCSKQARIANVQNARMNSH